MNEYIFLDQAVISKSKKRIENLQVLLPDEEGLGKKIEVNSGQ